jgi:AcrR family transcriptional regulator
MHTMASPVSPRRARRRERTRQELLTAARALIAERGVAELRVSDVTERIDIALGSFYSHFETKDQIVEAVLSETVAALADAIGDVGDHLEDPAEATSIGIRKLVGLCDTDPELARLLVRLEDAEPRFERMVWPRAQRIMRRGIDTGRFQVEDDALALTIAIAGVLAAMRAAVDGRVSGDAGAACAAALLRSLGIDHDEARAIAARPLPSLPGG